MSLGTEVRHIEEASEKMRPRAEASGMVLRARRNVRWLAGSHLRARRKLAGWQGKPWPVSSMWKRKESSQARQDSRAQKWFRMITRSFSVK